MFCPENSLFVNRNWWLNGVSKILLFLYLVQCTFKFSQNSPYSKSMHIFSLASAVADLVDFLFIFGI